VEIPKGVEISGTPEADLSGNSTELAVPLGAEDKRASETLFSKGVGPRGRCLPCGGLNAVGCSRYCGSRRFRFYRCTPCYCRCFP